MFDISKFKEYSLDLEPGTAFFQYTDGIPEGVNAAEEQFGTARILEALNHKADATPEEYCTAVLSDLEAFTAGCDQFDDITMLGFLYTGQ